MNRSLFSALWLEKMAISITIGLIVMVAALNIVASLILLVMEKNRDIAILKTMGATRAERDDDLHAAGADHRRWSARPSARRPASASSWVLDRYQLIRVPVDVYQVSYVPFTRAAARLRARRRRGASLDLLRRDDLSVAAGRAARSGAGAPIRIGHEARFEPSARAVLTMPFLEAQRPRQELSGRRHDRCTCCAISI